MLVPTHALTPFPFQHRSWEHPACKKTRIAAAVCMLLGADDTPACHISAYTVAMSTSIRENDLLCITQRLRNVIWRAFYATNTRITSREGDQALTHQTILILTKEDNTPVRRMHLTRQYSTPHLSFHFSTHGEKHASEVRVKVMLV